MRTRTSLLAGAALLVAATAQPVSAQASPDSRWQAFLGCWAPIVQDDGQSAAQHTVCFRPAADGVDVLTVVAGEITGRQHLAPDAGPQAVKDEQCEGTETATWSKDGARVYLRSTLQCGENVLGRDGAGAFALAGPSTLMEVEAVGVNDQYGVRVQHYYALGAAAYPASLRELATMGSASARLYASAPLTMPDIVDASTVLPPQALQAMLLNAPDADIALDADALLALAEAGVDGDVIDTIVALAYPERFAVATAPRQEADQRDYTVRERMYYPYDPFRYDPYGRYGYGFGYNSYNPYYRSPYGWYTGGTRVIIVDRDKDDTAQPARGRLVKGQGFTRPGRTGSDSQTSRTARPAVERSSQPSTSTGAASTSSGSSSSSSSERRAKPRPPGN